MRVIRSSCVKCAPPVPRFCNQIPFPSAAHIFDRSVYPIAQHAPMATSLAGLVASIVSESNGTISALEANAKLLLGFPCKDGSFPVRVRMYVTMPPSP